MIKIIFQLCATSLRSSDYIGADEVIAKWTSKCVSIWVLVKSVPYHLHVHAFITQTEFELNVPTVRNTCKGQVTKLFLLQNIFTVMVSLNVIYMYMYSSLLFEVKDRSSVFLWSTHTCINDWYITTIRPFNSMRLYIVCTYNWNGNSDWCMAMMFC